MNRWLDASTAIEKESSSIFVIEYFSVLTSKADASGDSVIVIKSLVENGDVVWEEIRIK